MTVSSQQKKIARASNSAVYHNQTTPAKSDRRTGPAFTIVVKAISGRFTSRANCTKDCPIQHIKSPADKRRAAKEILITDLANQINRD
ncbi:MAG: hypothetical protein KDE09_15565 [Anaerolineales bacterium]|nr:hypothetical protein [Anaerolineales bacterium]MCB0019207.1 hypothetical protein [Anaerolineales bacterium]